ncbi:Protein GrpE [termite gut metagenome]|uniref:Protein GrpE n=2 Tax=termite gut metagenome TaxID=433724 RepID=A0A5J4SZF9_9ZZZZ
MGLLKRLLKCKLNPFKKNKDMNSNEKETIGEEELHDKEGLMADENILDNDVSDNEENTDEKANAEEPEVPLTEEEKLIRQLEQANAFIEEQKDKYLRLSAEFDNYRKRTIREKAELILNGSEKTINSILPIIDDMERAIKMMETSEELPAIREGMELIFNKFISILGQNGVKVIETKDKPLDTDYHEAIAVIPAPSEELKGQILDCVQTGYTLNDKVIRHAKVVVGE